MLASQRGYLEAVRILVGARVSLDARNSLGNTALHLATQNQHLAIVRQLLAAGANPRAMNNNHQSPADIADITDNPALVDIYRQSATSSNWWSELFR